MAKIRHENGHISYMCPGCGHGHTIPVPRWSWNGSLDKPTVSPSVRHFINLTAGSENTICHYFITDGYIQYCNDCEHKLAGQTVELPEYDRTNLDDK